MMEGTVTYRKDLYYLNTCPAGNSGFRTERVINKWHWWAIRIFLFWKFDSFKNFNVLYQVR